MKKIVKHKKKKVSLIETSYCIDWNFPQVFFMVQSKKNLSNQQVELSNLKKSSIAK